MKGISPGEWLSFHLFYHGDLDQVLTRFVRPAAGALWAARGIDSFFFIRYRLGGPHVRLRVRPCPGWSDQVTRTLRGKAEEFLHAWPSPEPLEEDAIRKENQLILGWNPGDEWDDSVYPDNSFLPFPPFFEIDRYGGLELFGASLDFFALSSLQALRFLEANTAATPAQRLARAFSLLARQACGFTKSLEELLELFKEPIRAFGPLAPLAARGDRAFEERREAFRRLFPGEADEAARLLAGEIRSAPPEVKQRVVSSQLHMTANRLGLKNTDEIYLARLLERTAADLAETPAGPCSLREVLARPVPEGRLRDLLGREMSTAFSTNLTPLDELPASPQPAQQFPGETSHV